MLRPAGLRGACSHDRAAALVRKALRSPVCSPPLAECARGAGSAVVVISDHTRRTALRHVLPAVFEELKAAGVRPDRASVLVAYGDHPRLSDRETRRLTGPLPRGVGILHHDSSDPEGLVPVVRVASGELVRLNRRAVEAELLVVTGAITFHYHAGFTGGPKALLPGIAAHENILANHARTLSPEAPSGRDARCQPGQLCGNPVHEAIEAVARAFVAGCERAPFLVNSVLTESNELAAVFAGDLFRAFERGAEFVDAHFARPVKELFDIAIASAGGHPRDATLYQAHKAFDHAARAVRDGGVVVLAAACGEGAGPGFLDWFRHASYEEHLMGLEQGFAVPGQTALALRQKLARVRGVLVSRMDPRDVRRTGLVPARRLDQGLRIARELLCSQGGRSETRACLIPHAAVTLPRPAGT